MCDAHVWDDCFPGYYNSYMVEDIIEEVEKSSLVYKVGGPFGAVIYKDGEIVGKGVNSLVYSIWQFDDCTVYLEVHGGDCYYLFVD